MRPSSPISKYRYAGFTRPSYAPGQLDLARLGSEPRKLTDFKSGAIYRHTWSRDGKWLAYVSNESARDEVYIQPVDGNGARVQVSIDGGNSPLWSICAWVSSTVWMSAARNGKAP